MSVIAWVVLSGSLLWLAAVAASFALMARMGRNHQAGSEFVPLALFPLYLPAPLVAIAGAAAGCWLAAQAGSTIAQVILYLVAGLLAVAIALSLICVLLVWAAHRMIRADKQVPD